MKLLEMNHIKKAFGSNEVLRDISLSVSKGEVVAIIGPSGKMCIRDSSYTISQTKCEINAKQTASTKRKWKSTDAACRVRSP